MGSHTIDDVDDAGKKRVQASGELYLGADFQGKTVEYAVRVVDDDREGEEADDA